MEPNQYIIPANSKKSALIFGLFRPVDLIIFGTGGTISMLLLLVVKGDSFSALLVKLGPVLVSLFLVLPIPNYHNTLVLIRELFLFYMNRRIYLWKGWCVSDESNKK